MLTTTISQAPDQYQKMLDNYASILEKTNNQLGLSLNVSTWSVGVLSAFISIIAIGVGWYLWKNSKEQKDLFKETIFRNQENIENQNRLFIEQKALEMDNKIADLEKTKKSVIKEGKDELDQLIKKYKKERQDLTTMPVGITSTYIGLDSFNGSRSSKSMICTKCGKSFDYYSQNMNVLNPMSINYMSDWSGLAGLVNSGVVYCAHCGAKNVPQ